MFFLNPQFGKNQWRLLSMIKKNFLFIIASLFLFVSSIKAETITGTLNSPPSNARILVLDNDGDASYASITNGKFTVSGTNLRLFVLVNGNLSDEKAGPIYFDTTAKVITNRTKHKSCSKLISKAKLYSRVKVAKARKPLKLGKLKYSSEGYWYLATALKTKDVNTSTQLSLKSDCNPDAATGSTLGLPIVGSLSRSFSGSSVKVAAAADDNDGDGLPDALDVDDDDDGILDAYDSNSGSSDTSSTFHLFSNLKVNIESSLNVNAGNAVTQELINDLVSEHSTLAIEVAGGNTNTTELDCGPNSTSGLSYCASGGTGVSLSSSGNFPDDLDADNDGFGTIVVGDTGDFQLSTGATAEEIKAGDTYREIVTDSGNNETVYTGMLNFIFNTTPAVKSVTVGATTTNITYPVNNGDPGTSNNCISVPATGNVTLSLVGWRPQRPGIEASGEAEYVDIGNSLITIDIPNAPCTLSGGGGCSGSGPGNCSSASYSTSDSNLSTSTNGLQDSFVDTDANAANTFSFDIDLSNCLGDTAWTAGQSLFLDLQFKSREGDNAAQKFCVKRAL